MRLLLLPHAPTDWNAQGRYQGHSDTVLSELGRRQAAMVAARLQHERIDTILSSDLQRAVETANALCERRQLPWKRDARLRELNFGAWEGLTHEQVRRDYPDALINWEIEPRRTAPPGGETVAQFAERVGAVLADLAKEPNSETTQLLVAHRGSLRVLICLALGLPPESRWQLHLEPASLSELHLYPKGAVLMYLNDTHHLRGVSHAG